MWLTAYLLCAASYAIWRLPDMIAGAKPSLDLMKDRHKYLATIGLIFAMLIAFSLVWPIMLCIYIIAKKMELS